MTALWTEKTQRGGLTAVPDDPRGAEFRERGFLVLPGLVPADLTERLRAETDRWVDEGLREASIRCCLDPARHGVPPVLELELPAHGELLVLPALMQVLAGLLGPAFAFHHLHSDRRDPGAAGAAGKPWHHDREVNDALDDDLVMVHVLHYLGGLDATVGPLTVLPGSHRYSVAKTALAAHGTDPLAGEVVVDTLPPGSTVVLNSALFHARRPAPPGPGRPRYMVDASYCQVGARWRPVKPYWRHMLARARELGLDRGRWPDLFAEEHFSEFVGNG